MHRFTSLNAGDRSRYIWGPAIAGMSADRTALISIRRRG
jgi:hypothetical protein